MGLFDNVTSALNRGRDAAERTSKSARLKIQMNDLARERRELVAQLGASLYEAVKDNEELREGREELFVAIASVDDRQAGIRAQLDQIEAEAAAAREAAAMQQTFACPNCGTTVSYSQAFCTGCGTSVAELKVALGVEPAAAETPAADGPVCVSCGARLEEGDIFCVVCGTKQPAEEDASEAISAPECEPEE